MKKYYIHIPYEIISDSELTVEERYMLAIVNSLPIIDGKKKASNQMLSEIANLPEWKVDRLLRSLVKKGKISIKNKQSVNREFTVSLRQISRSKKKKTSNDTSTDVSNHFNGSVEVLQQISRSTSTDVSKSNSTNNIYSKSLITNNNKLITNNIKGGLYIDKLKYIDSPPEKVSSDLPPPPPDDCDFSTYMDYQLKLQERGIDGLYDGE